MADTAENLRSFLLADATVTGLIGTRLYHNQTPGFNPTLPFVWIRRRGIDDLDLIDGDEYPPFYEYFDLEAVSDDVGEALAVADACRDRLHGHKGVMGAGAVNGIRVQDQSDDYLTRNDDADERLTVAALDIEVTNV